MHSGTLCALFALLTFHSVQITVAQGDFFYTSFFQKPVRNGVGKYFFHREIKLTWYEANNFCLGRGKTLPVIDSLYEDTLIAASVKSGEMFWIDGTDEDEEGTFVWSSTGEPISYWNWPSLNLTDRSSSENCLAMSRYGSAKFSGWHDLRCSSKYYFICEK